MRLQQADNNKQQQQQQQNKETDKQTGSGDCETKLTTASIFGWGIVCVCFDDAFVAKAACIKYLCAAKYATHKKCSHPARRLRATFRTQMKLRTTEKKVARRSSRNYMPGKVCYLNVALSIFTFLLPLSISLSLLRLVFLLRSALYQAFCHARLQRQHGVGEKLFINNDFPLTID